MKGKVLYIELNGDEQRNIKESLLTGEFFEWTNERIRGAFRYHNGTIKDLKRYIRNNKGHIIIPYDKALKICPNSPYLEE